MKGISFPEQTTVYGKPAGWKDEDCYGLPVAQSIYYNAGGKAVPCLVSCWELTPQDIAQIQKTGKIYLSITGTGMPPVSLYTESFPEGYDKEAALEIHNKIREGLL